MMHSAESRREELIRIVRDVRARWRWKVVLRSLTVLAGAGVVTLLAAAYGLEQFRFSPPAVVTFRAVTYVVLVTLGWLFFVRPLARRVSDQQVALYLEEHEPALEAALLSAVDVGSPDHPLERSGESAALLRRLVESAIEKCQQVDFGRDVERQSLRRSAQVLGAIGLAATVVYLAGPAYLRHGALALLLPVRSVEAASPYRIEVTPGHATVARGADVAVAARLMGFTSTEVDIYTRAGAGAPFERAPMIPAAEGTGFESMLFGLRQSTEYFVQSAGVRSAVFTIAVADLPYVERLELELVFPAYTGLPPQRIERGGDIAALRGTTVHARVHSTLGTGGGRIVRDDRHETALAVEPGGTLIGSFEVTTNGFYRVELQSPAGTLVSASPQYTIDVLADQPPAVSFSKPGRDLRPTNIEEVLVEARADDDFGVRQLDLVFSVNGGQERSQRLVGPGARPLRAVTAAHTFFLEEMDLQPGDVVSYYARASDNDTVQGAKSATSDMYFLQVRPFRKDYRAAESQAGGQGAGAGGAGDPSALSEQQRRIVSGTFNVVRDRERVAAEKFRENVVFLTLAEGQLRERVETLAGQINARVGQADETVVKIAGWLGEAAAAMREAEGRLQKRDPKGALPPEQQALASLQRAEEAYRDVRVRMGEQQGGGGGGGQSSSAAEELADLFQLEMDKLRNQYETFQRGEQQAADNQVDEMLERLKELARRQEQEAERQRQLASSRQGGGGASGARQRQLADETEEAARRLERLSREENRPDLADAARRMREAADAMRRAAASGDQGAFAEASAAADRLKQARDRLERQRSDRMARDIQDALERVERLAEEQKDVEGDVRSLGQAGAARRDQTRQLLERKDAQAGEVADIERQLDRTASDFRRERPEAARRTEEAADSIRDNKLKEKIRYSKGLVQGAAPEAAANFEEQIGSDIATLEERLREAAEAVGTGERDARAEALDRARELLRGMESLNERLRERQGRGGSSDPPAGRGGRGDERDPRTSFGSPDDRAGGYGSRRPGDYGAWPDDWRQFQREARERRAEAQDLRRELQALGVDVDGLDRLIRDLRALDRERLYTDLDEVTRLQSQLVEGFRRFEFDLRRELGAAGADALFLSGSDAAPREYRKLIEEYYRQLARERKK